MNPKRVLKKSVILILKVNKLLLKSRIIPEETKNEVIKRYFTYLNRFPLNIYIDHVEPFSENIGCNTRVRGGISFHDFNITWSEYEEIVKEAGFFLTSVYSM